jgi:hypothetical protein
VARCDIENRHRRDGSDADQVGARIFLAHRQDAPAEAFDFAGGADGFDGLDFLEATPRLDIFGDQLIRRLGMRKGADTTEGNQEKEGTMHRSRRLSMTN